jgi:hypothetical protein
VEPSSLPENHLDPISALTDRLAALANHPCSYNYAGHLPPCKATCEDQSGNGCISTGC